MKFPLHNTNLLFPQWTYLTIVAGCFFSVTWLKCIVLAKGWWILGRESDLEILPLAQWAYLLNLHNVNPFIVIYNPIVILFCAFMYSSNGYRATKSIRKQLFVKIRISFCTKQKVYFASGKDVRYNSTTRIHSDGKFKQLRWFFAPYHYRRKIIFWKAYSMLLFYAALMYSTNWEYLTLQHRILNSSKSIENYPHYITRIYFPLHILLYLSVSDYISTRVEVYN